MTPRGVVLALAAAMCWGCAAVSEVEDDVVRVIGSDTMLELDRRLAEAFMRTNPGFRVEVQGGGSGVGIEALIEGQAVIAAASRPLSAAEVASMHQRHQTLGVRFLVAQDALSVFVNRANPVRSLSSEQLRGLFAGTITEWRDVGGGRGPVQVVVRPPSSGTHRFFRDHILGGGTYAAAAVSVQTTRGVLAEVAVNPMAIGYGGVAYRLDGAIPIAVDGVEPTVKNVARGRYPLTRYLVFYTTRPPRGLTHRFIEWCLGEEGQRVVADVGYVPLWSPSQ